MPIDSHFERLRTYCAQNAALVLLAVLFGITAVVGFFRGSMPDNNSVECHTDWDGRTNPEVCE